MMAINKKTELRFVKTGSVPSREDYLYMGGDPSVVHQGVVPLFYMRTDDGVVLIDSSFDLKDAEVLGIAGEVMREEAEDPIGALSQVGIQPSDVSHLILTHAHFDHVGFVDAFPRAVIYIHRKELEWVMDLPSWAIGYGEFSSRKLNRVYDQLRVIDTDFYEVLPGIMVHYVGGHAPGCMVVQVETNTGTVCLCGDNCFIYKNIEEQLPIGLYVDLYEVMAFIKRLPTMGDILLPGHDPEMYTRYPDGVIR
ncbi:MAG: N-acyl homoserine lactonase family protein [Anaerolineales bacterium]|nr:N-acyl homoserine lactonase family protein [Anaerolineales bacterium]